MQTQFQICILQIYQEFSTMFSITTDSYRSIIETCWVYIRYRNSQCKLDMINNNKNITIDNSHESCSHCSLNGDVFMCMISTSENAVKNTSRNIGYNRYRMVVRYKFLIDVFFHYILKQLISDVTSASQWTTTAKKTRKNNYFYLKFHKQELINRIRLANYWSLVFDRKSTNIETQPADCREHNPAHGRGRDIPSSRWYGSLPVPGRVLK